MKFQFPPTNVKARQGQGILADAVEFLREEAMFFADGANMQGFALGITVDDVEIRLSDMSAEEFEQLARLPNETELTLWIDGIRSPRNRGKTIYELQVNIPGIENTLCGSWETDI